MSTMTMMTTPPPPKPRIFISHAHSDAALVKILKETISATFARGVDVFATAIPGTIKAGENWFEQIRKNLAGSSIVVFLITPNSVNRPWLWFEMGASWDKYAADSVLLLPVCVGLPPEKLPPPLSAIQALLLTDEGGAQQFFDRLIEKLGFGTASKRRTKNFVGKLLEHPIHPSQPTDDVNVRQFQERLSQAAQLLIDQNVLDEADLSVLSEHDLLPLATIRELRKRAQQRG